MHEAHWILLKIIVELNQSNNDNAQSFRYCNLLQDHRHLMIVSAGQWIRRWINVREYPLKNQCFLQTRIIIINIAYSWTTLVLQTNPMVVNKESWFYVLEICPRDNHISLYSWLTKCSLNIHGWQLVLINAYVKYLWNSRCESTYLGAIKRYTVTG